MNMKTTITTLLVIISLNSYPQFRVMNISDVPKLHSLNMIPDVKGKVLVSEDYPEFLWYDRPQDTITVYLSWPVSESGQNERGGVYCNLDTDPELELVYPIKKQVYAFNIDGSILSGWPKTMDYPADGAAAYGDIDGDGKGEIVVSTHLTGSANSGSLYAFKANGDAVNGFPVILDGGAIRTPVLADIDGNGTMEIILAVRNWPDGFIYVYKGDGTVLTGWPVRMDDVPGSAVAVGDINGDGQPEIIAESYRSLHAYETDGSLLPGFPFTPGDNRVFSYSSPVLADLDGDGNREIVFGDHSLDLGNGQIYVLKYDGSILPGWPKTTSAWIFGPPSIADVDGDGTLDILVGDEILSPSPSNKVYGWNSLSAQPLNGFPITNVNAINNQIIIADLDGDHQLELMFDDNTTAGVYQGYNRDGTPMEGWPLHVIGTSFFIMPMVFDVNLDGILDLSGGGWDQAMDITYIYLWNAHVNVSGRAGSLPILQYNTRHNGVYGDTLITGLDEKPTPVNNMNIVLFPNPASKHLRIKLSQSIQGYVNVLIYDNSGRLVKQREAAQMPLSGSLNIDISGLDNGIYHLLIRTKKQIRTEKFIVLNNLY